MMRFLNTKTYTTEIGFLRGRRNFQKTSKKKSFVRKKNWYSNSGSPGSLAKAMEFKDNGQNMSWS